MSNEELILQGYKIYSEHKDKFVDRSFATNKFYLILVLALFVILCLTKDFGFVYGIPANLVLSLAGVAICISWWINVDSYNFLIKVKLSKVLEEIEKELPVKPYTMEFAAITDLRNKKREFLFADIQKLVAVLSLLFFFVVFINETISMFV